MSIKNKIAGILALGLLLQGFTPPVLAFNQTSALNYLKSGEQNEWTIMALAAAGSLQGVSLEFLKTDPGSKPADIEKRILALAAAGQNPETFGAVNLVQKLIEKFSGTEIDSPTRLINDDIFGLLSLTAASAAPDIRNKLVSFLQSQQNSDGGFGYTYAPTTSDSNDTAMAIMALLANGESKNSPVIQKALNYLETTKTSGGYSYDAASGFGPDSASTSWVMSALISADKTIATETSAYLQSLQKPDGSFVWSSLSEDGSQLMTAYAVIALSGKAYPIKGITASQTSQFTFRIEGKDQTVCAGETAGPTALDIVKNASLICNFTYVIEDTSFGPYLEKIGEDEAQGAIGWLYLINNVMPAVGAAQYVLQTSDVVVWYYGEFDALPLNQNSVSLKVKLEQGQVAGEDTGGGGQTISFVIAPQALDFGTLKNGETAARELVVNNTGNVNVLIQTTAGGDPVFADNLTIDETLWRNFKTNIAAKSQSNLPIGLSIPTNYQISPGEKTGRLTIWAKAL